ncbi:MAG: ferrochelatase [Proteobacteria bacterium]|nr:MAG: ferrochelatase [Pseudomonadota bacterium]
MTQGLLLVNLGTPDAPTAGAVRRYLAEFLSDPRVIDINPVGRWLLLHGIILRFRPRKSAAAYRQIWDERGSPLRYHSEELAAAVAAELGDRWKVALGMRYGRPSVEDALDAVSGAERVVVLPLYPQYASSLTGSTLQRVLGLAARRLVVPPLTLIRDFYVDPGFVASAAEVARPVLEAFVADHVLLSFHSVPEHQVKATDPSGAHCLASPGCCDRIGANNRGCYRAQSYATARALAADLELPDGGWTVAFQSRFGRIPWIRPYTDETVAALAKRGVKRLAVLCPSFVADCLETLEEIGIRAKQTFIEAGGEDLVQLPCVNAHPGWVRAVAALAREAVGSR